tara:strand:+ start:493 stop:882 length:390 start_codon:yes stop_codon:yes gene_type:complete
MNQLTFQDDKRQFATGKFATLQFGLNLEFHAIAENWKAGNPPAADANGPGRPAYDVYGVGQAGAVKVGAAWIKEAKRGDAIGTKFLTISIDDPSFDAPLNLSTWPTDAKGSVHTIRWERPRRAGANAAA